MLAKLKELKYLWLVGETETRSAEEQRVRDSRPGGNGRENKKNSRLSLTFPSLCLKKPQAYCFLWSNDTISAGTSFLIGGKRRFAKSKYTRHSQVAVLHYPVRPI